MNTGRDRADASLSPAASQAPEAGRQTGNQFFPGTYRGHQLCQCPDPTPSLQTETRPVARDTRSRQPSHTQLAGHTQDIGPDFRVGMSRGSKTGWKEQTSRARLCLVRSPPPAKREK